MCGLWADAFGGIGPFRKITKKYVQYAGLTLKTRAPGVHQSRSISLLPLRQSFRKDPRLFLGRMLRK